jgi:hypothetical protein
LGRLSPPPKKKNNWITNSKLYSITTAEGGRNAENALEKGRGARS